jgi:hypothetical protein
VPNPANFFWTGTAETPARLPQWLFPAVTKDKKEIDHRPGCRYSRAFDRKRQPSQRRLLTLCGTMIDNF